MLTPRLRHRITIQQQARLLDSNEEYVLDWVNWLEDEPAEVVPLSGRDFIQSATLNSQITARVTIRWRPDVSNTMRILFDGTMYSIIAVLPDATARRWLTLMVRAGNGDGA